MLYCWDGILQVMSGAWFPLLRIKAKQLNIGLIRKENPLGALFLQAGFHLSFTEGRLPSGHSAIKARLDECCSDGCTSGSFFHLDRILSLSSAGCSDMYCQLSDLI